MVISEFCTTDVARVAGEHDYLLLENEQALCPCLASKSVKRGTVRDGLCTTEGQMQRMGFSWHITHTRRLACCRVASESQARSFYNCNSEQQSSVEIVTQTNDTILLQTSH